MGTTESDPAGSTSFLSSVISNDQERGEAVRYADEDRYDATYVAMMVGFRWLILATYVGLALSSILNVHPLALVGSAGWIAASNVVATWVWRQKRPISWYDAIYPYLDLTSVVVAMLATANLDYPIWMAFVLLMMQSPSARSTRAAAIYNVLCLAGFALCVAVLVPTGWDEIHVGTTIVTFVMLALIAVHMSIMFDGNRRMWWLIRTMAITDSLTGLSNRRQFSRYLADPPNGQTLALILLDVDRFKEYNDSFGHLAGDQLLVRLASVLRHKFPDALNIARYGGDEFVVLLPCPTMEQAEGRVDQLLHAGHERLPVSLGIAMWPDGHPTLDSAFAAADDCLRAAKRSRRGTYAVWSRDGHIMLRAS